MARAIRWESSGPWPGVNQGRTSTPPILTGSGSMRPVRSTSRVRHSSSKLAPKEAARGEESTVSMTFSCSDQESSVQFAVADGVLVVHQVGRAGDRGQLAGQLGQDVRSRARRRGDRQILAVVLVVGDAHGDAAGGGP